VLQDGAGVRLRLGDVDWVVLAGLEGSAPFPPLLLGLEGLPAAVRSRLAALRGIPREVTLRGVNPAGAWTLHLELTPAGKATLPSWVLDTGWWQAGGR